MSIENYNFGQGYRQKDEIRWQVLSLFQPTTISANITGILIFDLMNKIIREILTSNIELSN